MNLRPRRVEDPEINMVSLIDVVLMMVVFFMLSSSLVDEGRIRIHLPQASSVPTSAPRYSRRPGRRAACVSPSGRTPARPISR